MAVATQFNLKQFEVLLGVIISFCLLADDLPIYSS